MEAISLLWTEAVVDPGQPPGQPPYSDDPAALARAGFLTLEIANTGVSPVTVTLEFVGHSTLVCALERAFLTATRGRLVAQGNPATAPYPTPDGRLVAIVAPGEVEQLLLRVMTAHPAVTPGTYPVELVAQCSAVLPGETGYEVRRTATIAVLPRHDFSIDIEPRRQVVHPLRQSRTFDIVLTNRGTDWLYADLFFKPGDARLIAEPLPGRVAVPPRQDRRIPLRVRYPLGKWGGTPQVCPLFVEARQVHAPGNGIAEFTTGVGPVWFIAEAMTVSPHGISVLPPGPEVPALVYVSPFHRQPVTAPSVTTVEQQELWKDIGGRLLVAFIALLFVVLAANLMILSGINRRYGDIVVEPVRADDTGRVLVQGQHLRGATYEIIGAGIPRPAIYAEAAPPSGDTGKYPEAAWLQPEGGKLPFGDYQVRIRRTCAFPWLNPLLPSDTSERTVTLGKAIVYRSDFRVPRPLNLPVRPEQHLTIVGKFTPPNGVVKVGTWEAELAQWTETTVDFDIPANIRDILKPGDYPVILYPPNGDPVNAGTVTVTEE